MVGTGLRPERKVWRIPSGNLDNAATRKSYVRHCYKQEIKIFERQAFQFS